MLDSRLIQELKEYFQARDDTVMAFVFGSHVREQAHTGSDWDIAVYFAPGDNHLEWEEIVPGYPEEDRIWDDCIEILKTDNVDLVVLNRAPASLADSAIRGIPLVIKDQKLFLEFMLTVTREAENYRKFVEEFYEISQRSVSLTPAEQETLRKIIGFIEKQMTLYQDFKLLSEKEYHDDLHKRNDVERWVENIVNATIDMSKIILASRKETIPDTYRDSLKRAVWALQLSEELAQKLAGWAKLRNVLAHEYLDIKWKRICDFIQTSESYVGQFVAATKNFLQRSREDA